MVADEGGMCRLGRSNGCCRDRTVVLLIGSRLAGARGGGKARGKGRAPRTGKGGAGRLFAGGRGRVASCTEALGADGAGEEAAMGNAAAATAKRSGARVAMVL